MPLFLNRSFGRLESGTRHRYTHDFPPSEVGSTTHRLRIKLRLAHAHGGSIILPDILMGLKPRYYWLQPLYFTAPHLVRRDEKQVTCVFYVDLLGGAKLKVEFASSDRVSVLDGTSELYDCRVTGPLDLASYATGAASRPDSPLLELYHHTTPENEKLIRAGGHYRLSRWNIAGTATVANYGFVYLTPLPRIVNNDDLPAIAMASEGTIRMLVDNGYERNAADVVEMKVYRSNSDVRQSALRHDVPCTLLAPQHVYAHSIDGQGVYYEVVRPLIHRVAVAPDTVVRFGKGGQIEAPESLKSPEHAIVGDATTAVGLRAPYEEDTTTQLLKLQPTEQDSTFLDQWFARGNSDLFSPLSPELPILQRDP